MSAASGITASQCLSTEFSSAVESKNVRFIKISIQNESLIHDISIPIEGSFSDDLKKLQDASVLQENVPAYVLAKLDAPSTGWLAIYYVPDSAAVRSKMLYASTRASLMKAIGSSSFTDSLFATSKDDLTAESYSLHLKHQAAPKPMTEQEKAMADIHVAERDSNNSSYQGSRGRTSMVGTGVGLNWTEEVENAVRGLADGDESILLVITIDTATETLSIISNAPSSIESLGNSLSTTDACYAFFTWPISTSKREIVFIYSCPSLSPIKHRMVYSSGSSSVFQVAKSFLPNLAARKIETSDPTELDGQYLASELGINDQSIATPLTIEEKKPFARPKGPGRRR